MKIFKNLLKLFYIVTKNVNWILFLILIKIIYILQLYFEILY